MVVIAESPLLFGEDQRFLLVEAIFHLHPVKTNKGPGLILLRGHLLKSDRPYSTFFRGFFSPVVSLLPTSRLTLPARTCSYSCKNSPTACGS